MTAFFWLVMFGGIALAAGLGVRWESRRGLAGTRPGLILAGGLVAILGFVGANSVVQVEEGTHGVVTRFGAATGTTLTPGLHFITPFIESVQLMDVKTVAYVTPAGAASRALQVVDTEVTLNYALDPGSLVSVYQRLRQDYQNRIIAPAVQEAVKAGTARYNAEELITRRAEVKLTIEDILRDRLQANGIVLDTLQMTDFQFSEVFEAAIEAKVVAEQRALEEQNRLRQIEIQAVQAQTRAEGEANAAIEAARGQAESIRLRAEAQAAANALLDASITDQLIRYNLVNGIAPGIRTIVLPAGQEFILGPEVLGSETPVATP